MLLARLKNHRGKACAGFVEGPRLASDSRAHADTQAPNRRKRASSGNSRGFTIVELLIVVGVLMIISAIAIPHLVSALDAARNAKAVGEIRTIETDILKYESDNGALPDNLSQVGDSALLDPWKNPYQYRNNTDAQGNGIQRLDRFNVPLNADYDLYSMGKDAQTASPITDATSQDDVIRVGSAGYTGIAGEF
jgi:general secretion pathway protein G